MLKIDNSGTVPEKLLNFKEAAEAIGAKHWQIQRLARSGAIPIYQPFNSRSLVKLSEVMAYIETCRQGGFDGR